MREKALHWVCLQISLLNSQMGKDWSLFSFLLPSLFQGEYPEIYVAFRASTWRPLFTLLASPSFRSVPDLRVLDNTDLSKTIRSQTYWSSWQRPYCTSLQVFASAKVILSAKYLQSTEIKLKKEEMKRFLTWFAHRNLMEQLPPWPRNEAGTYRPKHRMLKLTRAVIDSFCLQNRHRGTYINVSPLLCQSLRLYLCFEKPLWSIKGSSIASVLSRWNYFCFKIWVPVHEFLGQRKTSQVAFF